MTETIEDGHRNDPQRIARQPLFGIDDDGDEHRFDQYRDTVFVLAPDGSLEHVEQLQPGQLPDWVDYVDRVRGWADCRYVGSDDPFGALAVQLARALEPAP